MTCKNCGHPVESNFCSHCGQRTSIDRFNSRYIFQKFLDTFDFDRGFLRSVFESMMRPGRAVREYIDGKRVNFYNPIKLFLITGTVATLISVRYGLFEGDTGDSALLEFLNLPDQEGYYHYSAKYFTFFSMDALPFFALFSWVFFRFTKINFIENLVMNIYVAGGQFVLNCLYSPILIFYPGPVSGTIYGLLNLAYNIWAVTTFFDAMRWTGMVRSTLAVAIPSITVFFLNYLIYRLSPRAFWEFLDLVFD